MSDTSLTQGLMYLILLNKSKQTEAAIWDIL